MSALRLVVGPVDSLVPGMRRRVSVPETRRTVLVFAEADGYFAIENECPHHGASFDGGKVTDTHVVCPWHFWYVDFRTGSCLHNPYVKAPTYPVEVVDGQVVVTVPEGPSPFA